jgi:transcriptional regulator with XRE-family HTH domain
MDKLTGIGDFIRQQREAAEVSVRELARLAGVSNPYLSQIERGLRKPSAEVLKQIARGLSVSAESLFVRAGLLEGSEAEHLTIEAIANDPDLSEPQKSELLTRYRDFLASNKPIRSRNE